MLTALVLNFKGYDPTEVGLRKFLSIQETEVLTCLWGKEKNGAAPEEIRVQLAAGGSPHSPATIKKALDGLGRWGLVESRMVAKSTPRLCYFAAVNEDKATAHLVGRFLSSVKAALPEELARAAREQGIT
jgi:predicted transcriptional regulator